MNPKLFKEGMEGMTKLNQYANESDSKMAMALQHWSLVFTNMQLIANHSAPLHRDPNTLTPWFDLLCTVGDYEDCFMYIPTLRIILEYPPGTVVTFSGRLLRHAVNRVEGNRYTMVYYMQWAVHNWLGVEDLNWMNIHNLKGTLMGSDANNEKRVPVDDGCTV